jgi:hypothetical protein
MPTARDWEALDRVRRASVGQLLIKGARLLDERFVARINRQGPRSPCAAPTPACSRTSTRQLTELARRLGVTKQAAGQLVSDLARHLGLKPQTVGSRRWAVGDGTVTKGKEAAEGRFEREARVVPAVHT